MVLGMKLEKAIRVVRIKMDSLTRALNERPDRKLDSFRKRDLAALTVALAAMCRERGREAELQAEVPNWRHGLEEYWEDAKDWVAREAAESEPA